MKYFWPNVAFVVLVFALGLLLGSFMRGRP